MPVGPCRGRPVMSERESEPADELGQVIPVDRSVAVEIERGRVPGLPLGKPERADELGQVVPVDRPVSVYVPEQPLDARRRVKSAAIGTEPTVEAILVRSTVKVQSPSSSRPAVVLAPANVSVATVAPVDGLEAPR